MTTEAVKKKVLGCASCAGGAMSASNWATAPIGLVAQFSPLLALARAWKIPFAPYLLSVRGTFTDADVTVLPSAALENGQGRIDQITVVDQVVFNINQPTAFAGSIFKTQSDFFFRQQSGIECTLDVDGAPRYGVAPFFTPINAVADMLAEDWPMGWVLTYNQGIRMAFQSTIPLPSLPTTVIATFRMWQGVGADILIGMTVPQAWDRLRTIYAGDADMLAQLDVAQNAPVGR